MGIETQPINTAIKLTLQDILEKLNTDLLSLKNDIKGTEESDIENIITQCQTIQQFLRTLNRPLWIEPSTSRVRADAIIVGGTLPTVTTVTGVTTVTTVTTATTLTNLGAGNVIGIDIARTRDEAARISWANNIRNRIT